jgi:arabinosaccharide transport system substrate-binding protein
MKKYGKLFLVLSLVLTLIISGCSSSGSSGSGETEDGVTKLTLWSYIPMHLDFYKDAAERWNKEFPDRQIELETTNYPYSDMHNKLLVSLQSGVGAPDISDVEFSQFPNLLKGKPQILELNDIVEPVKDQFVESRLDIYSKEGKYYGLPTHVGATVMYYNKEILDEAGVNADEIVTWDDYIEAGKKVMEATGKPMTTLDVGGRPWTYWPLISQRGSDFFGADGEVTLDNEINEETLQFMYDLVHKDKVAQMAPGGHSHSEEYYGFMNQGGAASILMPFWYMGRFVDYMPDLKGKMIIKPLPVWEEGGNRSAGMGGTGTVVTNQAKNPELAKEFLEYAKLTKEGNIQLWNILGFDPPRWDVWESPELREANKFTEYFGEDIFDTISELKDEIVPLNLTEKSPEARSLVENNVLFEVIETQEKTPAEALKEAADKLRQ